ncbi:MAG: hypothetical protein IT424_04830 [Pirellulales bacterium]|nr:hypothetical protein [Pirellulales bacterium]
MSITRVGSTKKFSDNWDNIFGGGKKSKAAEKPAGKKAAKKSAKKTAGKAAKQGKK